MFKPVISMPIRLMVSVGEVLAMIQLSISRVVQVGSVEIEPTTHSLKVLPLKNPLRIKTRVLNLRVKVNITQL